MGELILLAFALFLIWKVWRAFSGANGGAVEQTQPKRAAGRSARTSPKDRQKENFWKVRAPHRVSANLRLVYEDAQGNETERDIAVRYFGEWEGGVLISAHCELRDDVRYFRSDRIVSAIDLETGEEIDDVAGWIWARFNGSPAEKLDEKTGVLWNVLRVLCYVGKADGQLRKAEREVIHSAVTALAAASVSDAQLIDAMVDETGAPDEAAFRSALSYLQTSGADLPQLLRWAEQIVNTQKSSAPKEKDALDAIRTASVAA